MYLRLSRLALLSLWLLGSVQAWAARTKVQPGWLWNYEGHIAGQHGVRMTLVFGSGEITGVYFHASQLKDIALRGRMLDATRVVLEELDAAAEQLLVDYERIFTPGFRQAIAQGLPRRSPSPLLLRRFPLWRRPRRLPAKTRPPWPPCARACLRR
jgi:hypothetical protein